MRRIHLAALNREVSVLGFGCASLGSRIAPAEGRRAIDMAIERGVSWFDVAPPYGDGAAEAILGAALAGRRDKVVICTKFGITPPQVSLPKRLLRPVARLIVAALPGLRGAIRRGRPLGQRAPIDPAGITASVEDSLRRLRSDYIDVLAMHEPTPQEAADGAIHDVLGSLVQRGLVRAISVAGAPASIVAAVDAGRRVDFAQFPDTPFDTAAPDLITALPGTPRPVFVTHGVYGSGTLEKVAALPASVRAAWVAAAARHGLDIARPEQLLLDFARANNPDGVVITSMFDPAHIERNCTTADRSPSPELAIEIRRTLQQADFAP